MKKFFVSKVLAVNALTLLRVIMTVLLVWFTGEIRDAIPVTLLLLSAIFLSVFLDGRLARVLQATTRPGAVFDIAADLFFIAAVYLSMIGQGVMPMWILPVVLLKFAEFCLTSLLSRRTERKEQPVFLFDKIGKAAISQFYILPMIVVLLELSAGHAASQLLVNLYAGVLTVLIVISSYGRIESCMDPDGRMASKH